MHTDTQTEPPRPLTSYAKLIHDIDPTVNPVGVECSMRLQYNTLDHLARHTFRDEIAIAKEIEALEPGELRRITATYGRTHEFDAAAAHVRQPENTPTDEEPALTWWTHAGRLYVVNAERPFERPARMRAVAHGPIPTGEDDIAIKTLRKDLLPLSRVTIHRISREAREYVITPDTTEALELASTGRAGTDPGAFERWPTGSTGEQRYWLLSNRHRTSVWMAVDAAVSVKSLPRATLRNVPALPLGRTLQIAPDIPRPPRPAPRSYPWNPSNAASTRSALQALCADWSLNPRIFDFDLTETDTEEQAMQQLDECAAELRRRHHPQMRLDIEDAGTPRQLVVSIDTPHLADFPGEDIDWWTMQHGDATVALRRTALRLWLWNAAHTMP